MAEHLAKYLRKGMSVSLEGRNQTSTYEKEGQKHYSTEIIASHVWAPKNLPGTATATSSAGESAPFTPPSAMNGGYGRVPSAETATDIPF
jgi:single-strand DNA-binding protein